MEEQQLERAEGRKEKEAEGRKVPKQGLSKLEKETFVTQGYTHELEEGIFIPKKKREALKLKSSSPRFKSMDDKNVEYIKPVTVIPPFTRRDKEGSLEIPRPKNKEVVMKLSDEIETRKRIEPVKSKVEFSTVNEEKLEREKISIEAVEAMFYPKAGGTTERTVLTVHTKDFINEVKFEKRRLKIPKTVENGEENLKELEGKKYFIEGETVGKAEYAPSFDDFEYIEKDEEIWITDSKTGLPSDAQLFLIIGRKRAGLEVLRGLLQLELFDRGRKPNPQILLPPENIIKRIKKDGVTELEKIEDIADDHYKFFRLIWAENYPLKYLKDEPRLRNEVYKALRKGVLKYIVFTTVSEKVEEIDLDKNEKRLSEEVKKEFEEIFDEFGNLSIIRLDKILYSEGQLKKLGQIFAKILHVAKSKFNIDSEISNIRKRKELRESIDALWQSTWDKKDSVLRILLDKYANSEEIRKILPPSDKLQNESDEHFVIKQLIVKDLLERGKKKWNIQPEIREEEGSLGKWKIESVHEDFPEEIKVEEDAKDKEGKTIKRPDLTVTTDRRKSIWIEIETCKNIKDPLKFVKDKLRKLKEIEDYEPPDELWLVFPYRKYFLYGSEQFKEMFIDDFNNFRRLNQIEKLKPRVFFSDLYDEKLVELKEERDF